MNSAMDDIKAGIAHSDPKSPHMKDLRQQFAATEEDPEPSSEAMCYGSYLVDQAAEPTPCALGVGMLTKAEIEALRQNKRETARIVNALIHV